MKSSFPNVCQNTNRMEPICIHIAAFALGGTCKKSGFNDPVDKLLFEVKYLRAKDCSDSFTALSTCFDYLNAYHYQANLETIGSGRYPGLIVPTTIVWFTDGQDNSRYSPGNFLVQKKVRFTFPFEVPLLVKNACHINSSKALTHC
jgi:hypothetical protein